MTLKPHSDPEIRRKIGRSIANTGYLNIWEGSIRSGKTVVMILAWLKYLEDTPLETQFIISGRTVATVEKNLVYGDKGLGILGLVPGAEYKHVGESRAVLIPTSHGVKTCYVVGASDIKAYQAIRGMSAGGWMADEINMHNRDFVQECFNRTALSTDRRHLFSLNPDNPNSWVYKDPAIGIDRFTSMTPEEKQAVGGVRWWHFTPKDNPIMTEERLRQLSMQYTGFAYRRYILGERAIAEGLIYPFIDKCIERPPEDIKVRYAGIDFGTVHPTAMGWFGRDPVTKVWYLVREWVATPEQSSSMTTSDYMDVFERITAELGGIPRMNLTIDYGGGGEALVREAERRHWMPVNPDKAVLDGIAITARMLNTGKLRISPDCRQSIETMSLYHWDEKVSERGGTAPVKQNDDPPDMIRYVTATFIDPRVKQ